MLRKPLVLLTVLLCLAVAGCSDENPVIEVDKPSPLDEQVISNCYTLQAAVEAYVIDSRGTYPQTPIGSLANPYTNLLTEPDVGIALYPGETCYLPFHVINAGSTPGYLITGFGVDGEVVALSNFPRDAFYFEEQTVANCLTIRDAVEAFAADNKGDYPMDTDADTNLLGNTVIDYLVRASYLENPFTGAKDVPLASGPAANPGETGYEPIGTDDINYAYRITGFGKLETLATVFPDTPEDTNTRGIAHRIREAVEAFAADNNGAYPKDLNTDVTQSGNTLRDLAGRWENIYTKQKTEPRDGLAIQRGQVGYMPVSRDTDNDGYIVNAWGLFGEVVRFEK